MGRKKFSVDEVCAGSTFDEFVKVEEIRYRENEILADEGKGRRRGAGATRGWK